MNQPTARAYCEKLNAKLPLPLSLLEFETFSNFSKPESTWIGISDRSNRGKKENWKDFKDKKPAYVKEWLQKFNIFFNILNHLKWYKTEPNGDGKGAYYNEKGVFDSKQTENHTVVCVQKLARK